MANASLQIEHAGPDHLEPALELLRRFFAEEGFTTPPEQIRVNLRAFLDERRYAAFLAHLGGAPVGVLTLSTSVSVELGAWRRLTTCTSCRRPATPGSLKR